MACETCWITTQAVPAAIPVTLLNGYTVPAQDSRDQHVDKDEGVLCHFNAAIAVPDLKATNSVLKMLGITWYNKYDLD